MLSIVKRHPKAFLLAVVVHLVFALLMGLSLHFKDLSHSAKPQVSVVEAVAVDEQQVVEELNRIKAAEQKRQQQAQQEVDRARALRQREEKRLATLKQQQQREQAAEQKRLARLKQEQQKLQQEQQKLQQEQQKLQEQRRAEEEQLKQAQAQRAREEKALQQLDKERKEEELKRKLAEEQQQAAAQNQARQSTIERYKSLIRDEVKKHWQPPPGVSAGMVCELRVRLLPSGEVIRVELLKSSGNSAYDRSVEAAVRQASPLPVPRVETGLFDEFRDLRFPFELVKR
ncbi:MAG: cell envelope integrity protein TolA [Gammaproteobacteria bacterium]